MKMHRSWEGGTPVLLRTVPRHIRSGKPAHGAASDSVRREMPPGREAGRRNRSRQTVCEDNYRSFVVVTARYHGSEREALDGVAGREPVASVEEVSCAVTFCAAAFS